VVGKTSLHDVDAEVFAGPDGRNALAGRAAEHLGQAHDALVFRRNLEKKKYQNTKF